MMFFAFGHGLALLAFTAKHVTGREHTPTHLIAAITCLMAAAPCLILRVRDKTVSSG